MARCTDAWLPRLGRIVDSGSKPAGLPEPAPAPVGGMMEPGSEGFPSPGLFKEGLGEKVGGPNGVTVAPGMFGALPKLLEGLTPEVTGFG